MLHVFELACDLISEKNSILSMVAHPIGNGPFSLVLPKVDFRESIDIDSSVLVKGDVLSVGGLQIQAADAVDWNPRPPWKKLRLAHEILSAFSPTLLQVLQDHAPEGSLATLLDPTLTPKTRIAIQTLEAAREPAVLLIEALHEANRNNCLEAARKLAGLGGGLTPQGDDFLMGCFLAVWAGFTGTLDLSLLEGIAWEVAAQTSPLSAAWVRSAARGECAEPWHILFGSVLAEDEPDLQSTAKRLARVGHTSGADALTGFLATQRGHSENNGPSALQVQ